MHEAIFKGGPVPGSRGYRPDIDGLRAIAVLVVVLFHAKLGPAGGFIGVDVFFVLSGYLITSIIAAEINNGKFLYRRFYERRARRILPALLTVIMATLLVGIFILLPKDLSGLAKSALSAIAFVSNIYFWRSTGYFDGPADYKPLLHSWSLGIEEQYYIFFPVVLGLAAWFGRRGLKIAVIAIAVLSFIMSVFLVSLNKTAPAFYLIPTRAWELMAGSLIALDVIPALRSAVTRTTGAVAGLGLIAWAAATYKGGMAFPGVAALTPCVGAALLVHAGREGSHLLTRPLSARPLVAVGLASYSLYLWHWPVLVFARYLLVRELTAAESVLAIAISFALSFLSLRFVEKPFRATASLRRLALFCLAMTVLCGIACALILLNKGLPKRFAPAIVAANERSGDIFKCPLSELMPLGAYYGCALAMPSHDAAQAEVALVGDSHAQMYAPALIDVLRRRGETGVLVGTTGCPPLLPRSVGAECARINRHTVNELAKLPRVRTVVLGLYWSELSGTALSAPGLPTTRDQDYSSVTAGVLETVRLLRSAGKQVVVIGPVAAPGYDVPSVQSRHLAFGSSDAPPISMSRSTFEQRLGPVLASLRAMEALPSVSVVYPHLRQCDTSRCYFLQNGYALFADTNHFAQAYAKGFASMLDAAIVSARPEKAPRRREGLASPTSRVDG